jgi:hypothetical protein
MGDYLLVFHSETLGLGISIATDEKFLDPK